MLTVYCGSERTRIELTNIINKSDCNIEAVIDPVALYRLSTWPPLLKAVAIQNGTAPGVWSRDLRIVRADGKHVVPVGNAPQNALARLRYHALLGKGIKEALSMTQMTIGYSHTLTDEWSSDTLAASKGKEAIQGKASIEGGNCLLFTGKDGKQKAIVGACTIALTMQNIQVDTPANNPSEDAYLRARNFALINQKKDLSPTAFAAPLTDKTGLDRSAKLFEAKEKKAKAMIAEDLGVSLDNIAFIPQTEYHIDLEVLVHPDGETVYVKREVEYDDIIRKIGCRVILCDFSKGWSYNFFNGIFLPARKGHIFVTNDTADTKAKGRFQMVFDRSIPVHFAQGDLKTQFGGIRCKTLVTQ